MVPSAVVTTSASRAAMNEATEARARTQAFADVLLRSFIGCSAMGQKACAAARPRPDCDRVRRHLPLGRTGATERCSAKNSFADRILGAGSNVLRHTDNGSDALHVFLMGGARGPQPRECL